MDTIERQLDKILERASHASIKVQTLGGFRVWRNGEVVSPKDWGRDTSLQLFQFFITSRSRRALRKEQIIDRLWEDVDERSGQQNFKVALHGINKVLEPERKSRSEAKYILRQGLTYELNVEDLWIDVDAVEKLISIGHQALTDDPILAQAAYREAIQLYNGIYLPNRLYEDWTSVERERIQLMTLGAIISLSELLIDQNPMESIHLAQQALQIDSAWEDAYRIQMQAYFNKGNRPMAIKTYEQCQEVLQDEFGIEPLPETRKLYQQICEV